MKAILLSILILCTACSQKKTSVNNVPALSPLSADQEEKIDLKLTQTLTLCSYSKKDIFLSTAIERDMDKLSKTISRFYLMNEMGLVSENEIIQYIKDLDRLAFIDASIITEYKIDEWAKFVRQTEKSFTHDYDLSQCRDKIQKEISNDNLSNVLKSALRNNLEAKKEIQKYLPEAQKVLSSRFKEALLEARLLILKIQEAEYPSDTEVDLLYDAVSSLKAKSQGFVHLVGSDIEEDLDSLSSITRRENQEYYEVISPEWSELKLLTYRRTLNLMEEIFSRIKHHDP